MIAFSALKIELHCKWTTAKNNKIMNKMYKIALRK